MPGEGGASSANGRLEAAIAAIDAANAEDPNVLELDGRPRPKELAHAEMVTAWVRRLDPAASEVQLLAARAHHLRRWVDPRSDHPPGRAAYLRWRAGQKRRHAAEVGAILRDVGYDDATVEAVGALVRKEGLGRDPAAGVHEDALCLVFLETQLEPVVDDLGDDKAVDVLVKTMRKMRPEGLAAAASLDLAPRGRRLLEAAVARFGDEKAIGRPPTGTG